MNESLVTVDVSSHIADVRINRPDKKNALSSSLMTAIAEAGKTVAANKDVRAVVLSGNGDTFCAGMDISNFMDPSWIKNPFGDGRGGDNPNFFQACAWVWRDCPAPVICALQGVAFGGGLQIALGADIRIAHPNTRLSVMEIKWGLIPDMSASQTLRDLVSMDVAKELTFTGRIVAAEEAHQLGLVTRVSETPFEDAMSMAAEIAKQNPDAISYSKQLFQQTWYGDPIEGLRTEEKLQTKTLQAGNPNEAMQAEMQKRTANFSQRSMDSIESKIQD